MAESSFESIEGDWEDIPTTSTPLQESIYNQRRKRRVENYLLGTGRATVLLESTLLRSLNSSETSTNSGEDVSEELAIKRQNRADTCTRGCSGILSSLAKSYEEIGRHCWPTKMY